MPATWRSSAALSSGLHSLVPLVSSGLPCAAAGEVRGHRVSAGGPAGAALPLICAAMHWQPGGQASTPPLSQPGRPCLGSSAGPPPPAAVHTQAARRAAQVGKPHGVGAAAAQAPRQQARIGTQLPPLLPRPRTGSLAEPVTDSLATRMTVSSAYRQASVATPFRPLSMPGVCSRGRAAQQRAGSGVCTGVACTAAASAQPAGSGWPCRRWRWLLRSLTHAHKHDDRVGGPQQGHQQRGGQAPAHAEARRRHQRRQQDEQTKQHCGAGQGRGVGRGGWMGAAAGGSAT